MQWELLPKGKYIEGMPATRVCRKSAVNFQVPK